MLTLKPEDYKEAYRIHATALRNWFVVYGIGGPALLLSNDSVFKKAQDTGITETIGGCFLLGAACQVVLSLIDKYADWVCYVRASSAVAAGARTRTQRIADWWLEFDWPSMLLDLTTMGTFGYATCTLFVTIVQ